LVDRPLRRAMLKIKLGGADSTCHRETERSIHLSDAIMPRHHHQSVEDIDRFDGHPRLGADLIRWRWHHAEILKR
jgi:hypothetical protein